MYLVICVLWIKAVDKWEYSYIIDKSSLVNVFEVSTARCVQIIRAGEERYAGTNPDFGHRVCSYILRSNRFCLYVFFAGEPWHTAGWSKPPGSKRELGNVGRATRKYKSTSLDTTVWSDQISIYRLNLMRDLVIMKTGDYHRFFLFCFSMNWVVKRLLDCKDFQFERRKPKIPKFKRLMWH